MKVGDLVSKNISFFSQPTLGIVVKKTKSNQDAWSDFTHSRHLANLRPNIYYVLFFDNYLVLGPLFEKELDAIS